MGRTIDELAARTGTPAPMLARLVGEMEAAGTVERVAGDAYRLSEAADREVGAALRDLEERSAE